MRFRPVAPGLERRRRPSSACRHLLPVGRRRGPWGRNGECGYDGLASIRGRGTEPGIQIADLRRIAPAPSEHRTGHGAGSRVPLRGPGMTARRALASSGGAAPHPEVRACTPTASGARRCADEPRRTHASATAPRTPSRRWPRPPRRDRRCCTGGSSRPSSLSFVRLWVAFRGEGRRSGCVRAGTRDASFRTGCRAQRRRPDPESIP